MKKLLIKGLVMISTIDKSAFYVRRKSNKVMRICGSYVEDSLNSGCPKFETFTKATLARFQLKPRVCDSFHFMAARSKPPRQEHSKSCRGTIFGTLTRLQCVSVSKVLSVSWIVFLD